MGRPPKYTRVEEIEEKIEKYFQMCDEEKRPYTIAGLAVALNLSRQGLLEYCAKSDENNKPFSDAIKKAKDKCEAQIEEGLLSGRFNPTGAIFNLKNNFKWKDKQEIEQNANVTSEITVKFAGDVEKWGK